MTTREIGLFRGEIVHGPTVLQINVTGMLRLWRLQCTKLVCLKLFMIFSTKIEVDCCLQVEMHIFFIAVILRHEAIVVTRNAESGRHRGRRHGPGTITYVARTCMLP